MDADQKRYNEKMSSLLKKNIPKLNESISESNLKNLLSVAQANKWLPAGAVQPIERSLDRVGTIQAAEKFFLEFPPRKQFLQPLCKYLWETGQEETAQYIDIEERFRANSDETIVTSTSCEASSAKESSYNPSVSSDVCSAFRLPSDDAGRQLHHIQQELGKCIRSDTDDLSAVKSYVLKAYRGKCDAKAVHDAKCWNDLCTKLNHVCAWDKNDAIGLRELVSSVSVFEGRRNSLLAEIQKLERF